jgi:DNA-binding XRE family transcriptional regulator
MPQSKLFSEDRRQRKERAQDWKLFRKNNLFTQRRLADTLGISRRTIQQIEGAYITPHPQTLRRFEVFKRRHETNAELS